jgi:hypothetical protein
VVVRSSSSRGSSGGAAAVLVGMTLMGAAGCSTGDEEGGPPAASGAPKQVAAVVERLERATRAGDFGEICDRLLTPAARLRAGGEGCEESLREGAGDLRRPRIQILSIAIDGERALARVRTRARGQTPLEDTIELELSGERYRIASLAG